jgi:multimeric flavodoxin WrbA
MRILAIVGSHRKKGNTAQVVGMVEAQMQSLAARSGQTFEMETLHLGSQDIRMCQGCRTCFDKGEERCPYQDSLQAIKARMNEADGLIVASPVYVNDVSGVTKNWMDRLAYVCHRPEFAGKCAYLLATVGQGPASHALRTLKMALGTWGCHIVGQAGFKTGALMDANEMESRYQHATNRIAQALFDAVHEQRFAKPSFLSLMTFKIQQQYWQRTTDDSIDSEYWRTRGWTDPDQEFYVSHRAGRAKVVSARIAGGLLARFVT